MDTRKPREFWIEVGPGESRIVRTDGRPMLSSTEGRKMSNTTENALLLQLEQLERKIAELKGESPEKAEPQFAEPTPYWSENETTEAETLEDSDGSEYARPSPYWQES